MTFSDIVLFYPPPPPSVSISLLPIESPTLPSPQLDSLNAVIPFSITHLHYPGNGPFTFLVAEVTPGYVLTFEDSELGVSGEKENAMFDFLCLGYLLQQDLF